MNSKKYVFIKEEEVVPSNIQIPREFIDRGKNCFVGIYYDVENATTIIGVPKYYTGKLSKLTEQEENEILLHLRLVCTLIEQIRLDSNYSDYRYNPYRYNDEAEVNKIELAEYLVHDYLEYGLYGLYHNSFVKDGTGINDWNRTVEAEIPVINEESIIYDPILGRKSQYSHNDVVSKIHTAVIKEALGILAWDEYQCVQIANDADNLDYGSDLSFYISILYERANSTFVEREKDLIKALIAWCGLTANNEKYYIGSTSFEHVWEYAIDKVFGNVLNKKSGVPYYYKYDGTGHISYAARGDLIPDSLRIEEKYFHIFDAKYYVWDENDREYLIECAPANSDISKQIGYFYYLSKLYGSNKKIFTNSFLAPGKTIEDDTNLLSYWGYAQQNGIRDSEILSLINDVPVGIDLEKVSVFIVNPTRLYKMCLSNVRINTEYLEGIFDVAGNVE